MRGARGGKPLGLSLRLEKARLLDCVFTGFPSQQVVTCPSRSENTSRDVSSARSPLCARSFGSEHSVPAALPARISRRALLSAPFCARAEHTGSREAGALCP